MVHSTWLNAVWNMAITDVLVHPQLSVLFIDPCLTRQYINTWPTACVQAEGGAATPAKAGLVGEGTRCSSMY